MSRNQLTALLAVWAVAMYGALQIHNIPGDWGYGICGSWGCGPPTQALVAAHGFWFVFMTAPTGFAIRRWPSVTLRSVGIVLTAASALALLAILVLDLFTWLPTLIQTIQVYSIQRYLFRVTTLIDLPVVPLLVAGFVCWRVGRRRLLADEATAKSCCSEEHEHPQEAQPESIGSS